MNAKPVFRWLLTGAIIMLTLCGVFRAIMTDQRGFDAIESGNMRIVRMVFPNARAARDKNGLTPLGRAASEGNIDALQYFLSIGYNPNEPDEHFLPLEWAIGSPECVHVLLSAGADPNPCPANGSPLTLAAANQSSDPLLQLLEFGANPNSRRASDGMTPLMVAVSRHRLKNVEIILESGADVNAKDFKGRTAADYAIEEKLWNVAQVLLELEE